MEELIVMFHESIGVSSYHHCEASLLRTFQAGEGSHDLFSELQLYDGMFFRENILPINNGYLLPEREPYSRKEPEMEEEGFCQFSFDQLVLKSHSFNARLLYV